MTLQEITKKITKRISDYIEFDVNEIFEQSDYITIYGGAVRDSIADLEIHDVDILCMSKSAEKLAKFLKEKYNYKRIDLYDIDSVNMYKGISLISEPWTLMNDNKKIIQIIKPNFKQPTYNKVPILSELLYNYETAYRSLIKNVDLSCCGVFIENGVYTNNKNEKYEGIVLREASKNAIVNCLSKTYEVNEWATLFNNDRTVFRDDKLSKRGWYKLSNNNYPFTPFGQDIIKKQHEREIKIKSLELYTNYDYKIWTEEEYINNIESLKNKNKYPF